MGGVIGEMIGTVMAVALAPLIMIWAHMMQERGQAGVWLGISAWALLCAVFYIVFADGPIGTLGD
ncbi:MAG: hypothetical protein HC788_05285 [Sphingopyxis sp.]|nr:hypothetical protein [Sphingopyxis sp.]